MAVSIKKLFLNIGILLLILINIYPSQAKSAINIQPIKTADNPAVYLLQEDGKRYVFPNEDVYNSWYNDFSQVNTISAQEMQNIPLGKNATIRPGTKLVKIQTDPKVYVVLLPGYLAHIPNEQTAQDLYGKDWAKRVVDVPDSFFDNYSIGTELIKSSEYPVSSIIKKVGSPDIYLINSDKKIRKFASRKLFYEYGYKDENVINIPNDYLLPESSDDITKIENGLRYAGWGYSPEPRF